MCGIAGIISVHQDRFSKQHVQQMITCLSHRGPDGEVVWQNDKGNVFLAHRRLSIIDLSPAGSQPMHYLNRYTIVHNGEVYNYTELREQLLTEGYSFHSQSDTEVIIAAYDLWKENCLQKFDGMFAFAIWDRKEQSFFAARDRFGEKPFYYSYDPVQKTLFFASEIKSFYPVGFSKKDYNGNLLLQYLATGLSFTADNFQTFHSDIQKLPARHYLKYSPFSDSNILDIEPYYDIDKLNKRTITPEDAVEQFRSIFYSSVQKRLRSDVEIGTSLSGGLDSSSVVAAIHHLNQSGLVQKAFTATFPSFERDEFTSASMITKQFKLQHYTVSPTSAHLVDDLEKFLAHHDEPVSSSSVYAQYKVYQLAAANGVKVLLDGQGADEILAGYSRHIRWFLQELYATRKVEQLDKELKAFTSNTGPIDFSLNHKLASRFPGLAAIYLERTLYKKQKAYQYLDPDFRDEHLSRRTVYKPIVKRLNDILYFDVFGGNLEELLRNADRNAMAHGIEVRLPFLHHELVEFVFSLPADYKLHDGFSKYLLRQSMEHALPADIVWRKDKVGFEPPQKEWMQDKQLQDKIYEAKKKLVDEKVLTPAVLVKPVEPRAAHEADNYDWRYLSAANIL